MCYGRGTFAICPHWGIDDADAPGTLVVAAGDGVIAAIGWDTAGWQTLSAHLQRPHEAALSCVATMARAVAILRRSGKFERTAGTPRSHRDVARWPARRSTAGASELRRILEGPSWAP